MIIFPFILVLLVIVSACWAIVTGYLLILTICAWVAPKKTELAHKEGLNRFLIIIPAHNEEKLIGKTVQSLSATTYPKNRYEVHVIADNCQDRTAEVAREAGAQVHERFNNEKRGKGYALSWMLEKVWADSIPHDAFVFIDADTLVSQNFLTVSDHLLQNGEKAIQAYYSVLEPQSWNSSLRFAALAVLHYLRPLGRTLLGGSAGLKGNGMIFASDIVKNFDWSSSLTEDIEFHMSLLLSGQKVAFAPDAIVLAEMPETLENAESQNERWEQGRIEMAQKYVPQLLAKAFNRETRKKRQTYALLDAAMEHLIPPFTIVVGLSIIFTIISIIGAVLANQLSTATEIARINLSLSLFSIVSLFLYLISGLILSQASKEIYLSLLFAPGYIFWKFILYFRVLFGNQQQEWIRTARND